MVPALRTSRVDGPSTQGQPQTPSRLGERASNVKRLLKSPPQPQFSRRSFVKSLPILCKMTCSSKGSVRILQRIGGKILGGKPLFLDPPTVSMHKLRSTGSRVIILGVWESPRGVRIENAQTI